MPDMANDWITTVKAAELTGYHPKHIRRLADAGAIVAQKFGRDWMVSRASILGYARSVEKLGKKRGPKPGD